MLHKGEINSNNLGNRAELTELVAFLANMRQKVLVWGLLIVKPDLWLFCSLVQYNLGVKSLRCYINTTSPFWFQSCVIALHPQLSWCQALCAYKEARKEEKKMGGGIRGTFYTPVKLGWLHLYSVIHLSWSLMTPADFQQSQSPNISLSTSLISHEWNVWVW